MYHVFSFPDHDKLPWDSVPVLKVTEYPFSKGPYKPYAMGSICRVKEGIAVRLISFCTPAEKEIKESNMMSVCLGKNGCAMSVACSQNGRVSVTAFQGEAALMRRYAPPAVHWTEGSDNLGNFWECDFLITNELLAETTGQTFSAGDEISCNVITMNSLEEHFHFGSVFSGVTIPSVCALPDRVTAKIV